MEEVVARLTVVVPTYNERENVEELARRVFRAMAGEKGGVELLVVDDDSPDGTAEEVRRLGEAMLRAGVEAEVRSEGGAGEVRSGGGKLAEDAGGGEGRNEVRCIVRKGERGLATAVIEGMRQAQGEVMVVMDADLSHPPEMIPRLLEALERPGVKMAIGSRFVEGGRVDLHWPLHRRLNSLMGRMLARPLTGVKDMMAGFFAVRKSELRLEGLRPIGYKIALELIVRHGWREVEEVPISFSDRAAGRTKLNMAEQMRYLRHLWRLYVYVLGGRRG